MKKIVMLLLVLVMYDVTVQAQANISKLTLQNCLETALANNIQVKQSVLQEQSDKVNYNQAKFNRLPNVSANVDYGINSGRSIDPFTNSYNNQQLSSSNAGLTASVPVFKGLKTNNEIKQASFNYQASAKELQQEKDNLTLNVILSFLQLMNDEDVLKLTKDQMAVTQNQVDRLDVLNKEGGIAPALLYDMKGQYAADRVAEVNAGLSLEKSKLALAQLMNVPYDKKMQIDREGIDLSIVIYAGDAASIYSTAIQNLALVKAADLRTQAAAQSKKIASADLYPTVSLFGQLGTNYSSAASVLNATGTTYVTTNDYVVVNGNNSPVIAQQTNYNSKKITFANQYNNNLGTYFGLNVKIPIFSSFNTRSKIKLAKIEEKKAIYIAENTRVQLKQAIEQAYLNMTSAYDKYEALKQQVTAYTESFRAAEIKFNLGALNSVEYLIVKNNLDRSVINFTSARYEYLLRTKILDFYQGKLN